MNRDIQTVRQMATQWVEACISCEWVGEPQQEVEQDQCPRCSSTGTMTRYYGDDPGAKIQENDVPGLLGVLVAQVTP